MTIGYPKQETSSLRCSSGDVTYYIRATGDDNNNGLTEATAFATIQKAILSIPYLLEHSYIIDIGVGNFAGFLMPSKLNSLSNNEGITIQGVQAQPVLGSGGKTQATADLIGGDEETLVDLDGGWVVNELRGMFLEIDGEQRVIFSNTIDTIRLVGPLEYSCNSMDYTILENKSILTTVAAASYAYNLIELGNSDVKIILNKFDVSNSVSGMFCVVSYGSGSISFNSIRVYGGGTATSAFTIQGSRGGHKIEFNDCYSANFISQGINFIGTNYVKKIRAYSYSTGYGFAFNGTIAILETSHLKATNCTTKGILMYGVDHLADLYIECSNNTNEGLYIYKSKIARLHAKGSGNSTYGIRAYWMNDIAFVTMPTITGTSGNYCIGGTGTVTGVWATDLPNYGDAVICEDHMTTLRNRIVAL